MTQTTTITSIKREFNLFPNIVGIVTTADLTTITTAGYWNNELDNVELLNNGVWQWEDEDLVLIYYSAAQIGFFTYDATTAAFVSLAANGGLSNTLSSGDIFVGNVSNVATGVPVTGIIAMSNTGVTTLPLTSAHFLVGNGSNLAAGVAMSGDATLANTGAVTIAAGAVTGSKIAANTVDYANIALDVAATATVALTAAQINGMYATPVLILAAPGVGKLIVIDQIIWDIAYGTAQFASGGAIAAQYGNTVHGAGPAASGSLAAASLNGVAASGYLSNGGISGSLSVTAAASLNTGVYISNATGAFTTGDSTANLIIRYRVITPV